MSFIAFCRLNLAGCSLTDKLSADEFKDLKTTLKYLDLSHNDLTIYPDTLNVFNSRFTFKPLLQFFPKMLQTQFGNINYFHIIFILNLFFATQKEFSENLITVKSKSRFGTFVF